MAGRSLKGTYSVLKDLMKVLRTESRSGLLQIRGLGPSKVGSLIEARESAQKEGRPLRMADVMNLSHFSLSMFTDDSCAAAVAKCISYYEREFSVGKKLKHTVSNKLLFNTSGSVRPVVVSKIVSVIKDEGSVDQ